MRLFPALSDRCNKVPATNASATANATNCLAGLLESAWAEAEANRSTTGQNQQVAAFVTILDDGHPGATHAWLRFASHHSMAAVGAPPSMRLLGSKLAMADLAEAAPREWARFFPATYASPRDVAFPVVIKLYPVFGSGARGVFSALFR